MTKRIINVADLDYKASPTPTPDALKKNESVIIGSLRLLGRADQSLEYWDGE